MNSLGVRAALAATMLMAFSGSAAAQAEIVLRGSSAPVRAGKWVIATDSSVVGGAVIRHPDAGASKIRTARSTPTNYFELTFQAEAGKAYRLWIRGRAQGDYWGNDSVFVQFSGSVNSSRSPIYRIGTTSAAEVNLESCKGCGLRGWKWQDNGYGNGVLGPKIYFARTGTQRMRVQTREDGLAIHLIVLSSSKYLTAAPPSTITSATSTTINGGTSNSGTNTGGSGTSGSGGGTSGSGGDTSGSGGGTSGSGSGGNILKVFHWNIHHGVGTDGVCNLDRIANYIVRSGANVVALNEVEKNNGWCGNIDMPARILSLVESKTGKNWNSTFAQRDGYSRGQGNMILTTFPIQNSGDHLLSYSRSVARIELLVGSRRVNIFSTHLDAFSASRRVTQMKELTRWASTYAEQRILTGDFNAWYGGWEISNMKDGHYDSWAKGVSAGTAVSFPGNDGDTRRSRIDYIFYSKNATGLGLKETRVFDVRDSRGYMPSDHRPLMATYEVR